MATTSLLGAMTVASQPANVAMAGAGLRRRSSIASVLGSKNSTSAPPDSVVLGVDTPLLQAVAS